MGDTKKWNVLPLTYPVFSIKLILIEDLFGIWDSYLGFLTPQVILSFVA